MVRSSGNPLAGQSARPGNGNCTLTHDASFAIMQAMERGRAGPAAQLSENQNGTDFDRAVAGRWNACGDGSCFFDVGRFEQIEPTKLLFRFRERAVCSDGLVVTYAHRPGRCRGLERMNRFDGARMLLAESSIFGKLVFVISVCKAGFIFVEQYQILHDLVSPCWYDVWALRNRQALEISFCNSRLLQRYEATSAGGPTFTPFLSESQETRCPGLYPVQEDAKGWASGGSVACGGWWREFKQPGASASALADPCSSILRRSGCP